MVYTYGAETVYHPDFSGVHLAQSLVLCEVFVCSVFFLALSCLSFFELPFVITPLTCSNYF